MSGEREKRETEIQCRQSKPFRVPRSSRGKVNLLVRREVPEIPVSFVENDNLVPALWKRHLLVGEHLDPIADHINPSANRSRENTNEQRGHIK